MESLCELSSSGLSATASAAVAVAAASAQGLEAAIDGFFFRVGHGGCIPQLVHAVLQIFGGQLVLHHLSLGLHHQFVHGAGLATVVMQPLAVQKIEDGGLAVQVWDRFHLTLDRKQPRERLPLRPREGRCHRGLVLLQARTHEAGIEAHDLFWRHRLQLRHLRVRMLLGPKQLFERRHDMLTD